MTRTISQLGSLEPSDRMGKTVVRFAEVDITSYTTGGESITAGDLGMDYIWAVSATSSELAYVARWDATNSKLLVYGQEPTNATAGVIQLTQLANAADAGKWQLVVYGI